MPTPHRLRLEPLVDISCEPSTEDTPVIPNPSFNTDLAVHEHSVQITFHFEVCFMLFQLLIRLRLALRTAIIWDNGSDAAYSPPPSEPTSPSPLPVIEPSMNNPDQETDRSSDSYHLPPVQETTADLIGSPPIEMPEAVTSEEPMPRNDFPPRRPTPYPASPDQSPELDRPPNPLAVNANASPFSSSDNEPVPSSSQNWQEARRAATLSYPSAPNIRPPQYEISQSVYPEYNRPMLLRVILPNRIETNLETITSLSPMTWEQFYSRHEACGIQNTGLRRFRDHIQNGLCEHIVRFLAMPTTQIVEEWYYLASHVTRIRVRIEPDMRPHLNALLFNARPQTAMVHGVRSAQLDILDHTINNHPRERINSHTIRNRIDLPSAEIEEAPPLFDRGEEQTPAYLRNLPTHLPHPLTLWQAIEETEPSTDPEVTIAELRVFPFNFREQWTGNGRSVAPTLHIIRPYREVIELLQFGNHLMLFLMECQIGPNWDHAAFPLTYISTLESLIPFPSILWNCYSEIAELQPASYFPPHPIIHPIYPPR